MTKRKLNAPRCNICKCVLDDPEDPEASADCGGDCTLCMANYGDDSDCIRRLVDAGLAHRLREGLQDG